MDAVTEEGFQEWLRSPVTKKLMAKMAEERSDMMEGLVNDAFEKPEEVKGRCRAIASLLNISYGDLYESRLEPEQPDNGY